MAKPNIEKMEFSELVELRNEIDELIASRKNEERSRLKAEMNEMAQQHGFDLDEIVGGGRGARKGMKVAVKYRDPNNTENTWTGRGRDA